MQNLNKILVIICIVFTTITCLVVGLNPIVEETKINYTQYQLFIDEYVYLYLEATPSNATIKSIKWTSSNPNIANVSSEGRVVAEEIGSCTITAQTDTHTQKCEITVIPRPVTEINLKYKYTDILIGETLEISSYIQPYNATYKDLQWVSSDSNIATVDQNGNVVGMSQGFVTIIAKSKNNVATSVSINVHENIFPQAISLSKSNVELKKGKTITLSCNFSPSNVNVKNVTWTSSNESVATVSSTGTVSALTTGTTTIKCVTDNGLSKTCHIVVNEIKATSILIKDQMSLIDLSVGQSVQLTCMILPFNTTDQVSDIVWESSNTDIAIVDQNGKLKIVGVGKATITARLDSIYGICVIYVTK